MLCLSCLGIVVFSVCLSRFGYGTNKIYCVSAYCISSPVLLDFYLILKNLTGGDISLNGIFCTFLAFQYSPYFYWNFSTKNLFANFLAKSGPRAKVKIQPSDALLPTPSHRDQPSRIQGQYINFLGDVIKYFFSLVSIRQVCFQFSQFLF